MSNTADPRFVRFYLEMPQTRAFIDLHTIGQAVKGINLRDVRRIPIALPPREEQEQLAETLNAAETALRNQAKELSKLQKLKTGLAQHLLTGRVSVAPLLAAEAKGAEVP